eukprot:4463586-Amphidinium_carterae.1
MLTKGLDPQHQHQHTLLKRFLDASSHAEVTQHMTESMSQIATRIQHCMPQVLATPTRAAQFGKMAREVFLLTICAWRGHGTVGSSSGRRGFQG